ncbi:MAG: hypothetical protein WCJ64_14630 [Rhodospirillaceae bacterium]
MIWRIPTTAGKEAALVELRRRFMSLPERVAPKVLFKGAKAASGTAN